MISATARRALVWGTCVAATAAAAVAAVAAQVAGSAQATGRVADIMVIGACCASGAVVLSARPGHLVGRLLLVSASLWGFASLLVEITVAELADEPDQPAVALLAVAALTVRGLGFLMLVTLLPLHFPDGRLPAPRWVPVRRLVVAALGLFAVSTVLAQPPIDLRLTAVENPLGVGSALGWVAEVAGWLMIGGLVAGVTAGLAAVVVRWRRGDELLRQQVGWFAGAMALTVVLSLVVIATEGAAILFPLATAAIPVAVGVAVLQHRLYDIDVVLNRALLYGGLSATVVALYVLVVAGVGAMVGARGADWLGLLAAAVVAVAFQPLREALQRGVNRLTYGAWDEPYAVLARLTRSLDGGTPLLADALGATRDALRLDYLEVADSSGKVLARAGNAGAGSRELSLTQHGATVGTLGVSGGRRRPRARDERLLADLAGQLAPVVAARQLTAELQHSRQRLVTAREEERRRLRRDLHDGVGSALAGLTLQLDTARRTARADPGVSSVLRDLQGRAGEVVADVRRAVEDLRPPALDDLGLNGVLTDLARRLRRPGLQVDIATPGELPVLPAAVEVAAYRIAQEALTNVVRHSGAGRCAVTLWVEPGELRLEVTDDGRGLSGSGAGAGLATMRERAEELGGTLAVQAGTPAGTTVRAVLPVGPS